MPNRTLSWYDAVATLYDLGTLGDWFYRAARREAVDRLQLAAGEGVVDLFCGTGVDVPLLREAVGARGTVVGADGSENMRRCTPTSLPMRAFGGSPRPCAGTKRRRTFSRWG